MPDLRLMSAALAASTGPRFRRMNEAMAGLLDDYSMVGFSPLDISEEDSVSDLLAEVRLTLCSCSPSTVTFLVPMILFCCVACYSKLCTSIHNQRNG